MRLLCLHGVGSSGAICESQFQPFIKATDPSYEFVFVDGPAPSIRGPGMGGQFSGPFWSHTEGYHPDQMVEALNHLEGVIEELGPFDGCIGFSQGAATLISYIYDRQRQGLTPFKFALFFSAVCAFSPDPDFGGSVIERTSAREMDLRQLAREDDPSMQPEERAFVKAMANIIIPLKEGQALLPDIDMGLYSDGNGADAPRLMIPELMKEKLRIPVFHMAGKKDAQFMRDMTSIAKDMCDKKLLKTSDHSGTHHPPQKDAEVRTAVRALDWAISQSQKMGAYR